MASPSLPRRLSKALPRSGFTLVELLTVIAIIGVLISLLLPAIQSARESARKMECASFLRQMGLALAGYEYTHKQYPAGCAKSHPTLDTNRFLWSGAILPFLEQNNVARTIDLNLDWNDPNGPNAKALQHAVPIYRCPSANAPRRFSHEVVRRVPATYLACASGLTARESGTGLLINELDLDGMFFTDSRTNHASIQDGTSSTVMVGEALFLTDKTGPDFNGVPQLVDHWAIGTSGMGPNEMSEALGSTAAPINQYRRQDFFIEDLELGYSSRHIGGAQVVFADGHVQFIAQQIHPDPWSAMGTRAKLDLVNYLD